MLAGICRHRFSSLYNFKLGDLYLMNPRKQSLRAVLRTLIKIYTFAPNFKFGTK